MIFRAVGIVLLFNFIAIEAQSRSQSGPAEKNEASFNYDPSRARFRLACERLSKAQDNTRVIECDSSKILSPKDPDLTIDTLFAKPERPTRLLVIVCGTHGAEAFAACHLLRTVLEEKLPAFLTKGLGALFVHAANPFGFKNRRRVTENNIDLNRNFIINEPPKNEGYRKLQENLEPEGQAGSLNMGFFQLSWRMISRLILRDFSLDQMRQAVASGQFEFKNGLFFGGQGPEPQVAIFRDLFQKTFRGFKEIVFLDVHTGLGKKGIMHLIQGDSPSEKSLALLDRIIPQDDRGFLELTLSTSKGFFRTSGSLVDFAQQIATIEQTFLAITMEFGTLGDDMISQLRSLNRMVMENQGAQHGFRSEADQVEIQNQFRDLFFPASPEWREEIMTKGMKFFSRIEKNF